MCDIIHLALADYDKNRDCATGRENQEEMICQNRGTIISLRNSHHRKIPETCVGVRYGRSCGPLVVYEVHKVDARFLQGS